MAPDMLKLRENLKEIRKKCGNGRIGLTEEQKTERIKMRLGKELNKVKKFNKDGVKLLEKGRMVRTFLIPENHQGPVNIIPENIIKNLDKYPQDKCDPTSTHKIVAIKVGNDGQLLVSGILKNGKEHELTERTIYSVITLPDDMRIKGIIKQFKKGSLKEIEPELLPMLDDDEILEEMLSDSEIKNKTNEKLLGVGYNAIHTP